MIQNLTTCLVFGVHYIDRFLNNAFKETAVIELQKPLQNQGKPDSALLTKVFLREAESHSALNGIQSNLVEAWMQAFTEAYFQETNSFLSFQVTKEAYYEQLRAKIGKVVFSGMAIDGTVVDEPGDLARIFVMPDVQRQSLKRYEIAESPSVEIASDEQKLIQREQRQQLLLMKGQATDQRTISAVELLNEGGGQRVVLLGAPGAGKTTLINYLVVTAVSEQAEEKAAADSSAVSFGQYFPVLIRIRDLARSPDLSVLEFLTQFAEKDLGVDGIPTGFFQHWLKTGRSLILLDGLDEVADNTQRRKVVEKIETFLGACDRCPTLITSRPAGYRDDYFSRDQYPHYELLPFDDAKIETFINHWYDSRVDLETERERRKGSLRKALSNQPRIKQLARNPLLLTIIAVIHRYKTLPKQRHELYHSAVETLISTWDEDKELTIRPVLKHLDIRDIRRLMKQLAYWIHTQGSVEDAENGTQIARGDLIRQLGEFIREMKASDKLKRYQATEEAEAFLDKIIKDRAGLLSQQGQNRYAFVHKTFQEYLCSQEILYLQEDQDPDDDDYVPHTKNHIQKHLHDPHWREVLLLLVAQQAPTPAKASLKTILKADSEYEQWLHRDLLFAGSCLAENAEIADRATIDQILTELVNLEVCSPPLSDKIRREVFRVISSLQDTPFALMAMKLLEKHQQNIDQWRFIDYQGELEPDQAIRRLLLLSEDSDSFVRYRAAKSLGQLGNTSEAVISELLLLLKDSDSFIRYRAAASLGQLGNTSEAVISE
ncbi:MAG: NACHT domain-containing protein, partial [Phormidesmis sp.]